jgi:hypothetical protein
MPGAAERQPHQFCANHIQCLFELTSMTSIVTERISEDPSGNP